MTLSLDAQLEAVLFEAGETVLFTELARRLHASEEEVRRALDTLKEIKTHGRKIAILGDMLELGKYSTEAHRAVGERATLCADTLITVGFRMRTAVEAALDAGMDETVGRVLIRKNRTDERKP